MKVLILAISGDRKMTQFMQACDVFEPFKVLGEVSILTMTLDTELKTMPDDGPELINVVQGGLEKVGRVCSLVHIQSWSSDEETITFNKRIPPYINPAVKAISSGRNWAPLWKAVKSIVPIELLPDEYRQTT